MGSEHNALLFNTEIQWLLCGQELTRVFKLWAEITHFLHEQCSDLIHTSSPKMKASLAN